MQTIMPRWLNNVLVMTCTAMTTVLMIVILVLLAKHLKMKALVSMLAISSLPPPIEAANFTAAAIASALVAPNPAIGTKVVCAYPVAVIWQNILGYLVLAYAIAQYFRPVTWCKGYKYNKKCALYIFVYDNDHERYSPLKIMSLKEQMHNYRMKYTEDELSLTLVRSWTYDTMTISWEGVQVMDKSDPINPGRAFGVWNNKDGTFQFKLPSGICTADVTFMGTSGVQKFYFTSDSAKASHVAWEHLDYDHTTDAFLLDCAFTHSSKHPQVVELPLPRVTGFTKYYNPTRPSHLVGGALVRCHRSYSPTEIRSMWTIGLEQSPAYFSRRAHSASRTPSRVSLHNRTRYLSQS